MQKKALRSAFSLFLVCCTLGTLSCAAGSKSPKELAAQMAEDVSLPLALIRSQIGVFSGSNTLSPLAALAVWQAPILSPHTERVQTDETASPGETKQQETDSTPEESQTVQENGVPSRTLRPAASRDSRLWKNVYLNNSSSRTVDFSSFDGSFAARFDASAAPQVLIVHTHATESYTQPSDAQYEQSDNCRTPDDRYNMIAIGEEIAQTLSACGIGVIHDCTLHDYPSYSGSYGRSLDTVESVLKRYPDIAFVLDIHRDAVTDGSGTPYKLLCEENPNAAQLEFVIGTDGGGAKHDNWQENLKLACAVQQTVSEKYPTLMRPIVLRNSRYNQHTTTGSLLLEVGTAGNSLEEARNAAHIFAECFAETVQNAAS